MRDIRQNLQEVFQSQLPAGAVGIPADHPVITRFSDTNSNLDKLFKAILHRAGLVPWPKLFQNLRASCETEWLNEGHPAHVVAAWIGHSVKVQRDSYAQITDGHFERFNSDPTTNAKSGTPGGTVETRNGENRPEVAHQVAHTIPAKTQKPRKTNVFRGFQ